MRKPQIKIRHYGHPSNPWVFIVKWPGLGWRNSQWLTFDEALVAAGVKKA